VAFSSSSLESVCGGPLVYLQGVAVSKRTQGKGILRVVAPLTIALEMEKAGITDAYMGARTQSPILFKAMVEKCGMYPRPGEPTPLDIQKVGFELARLLYHEHSDFKAAGGLRFEEDKLIQRKAYGLIRDGNEVGLCMYGDSIPYCRNDKKVNQFFDENLDFRDGDAFVMVGRVNHGSAVRQLEDTVEKANRKLSICGDPRIGHLDSLPLG
jgi:hypothetical protein